ncbi:hypothetical protein MIMGU_mgv1a014062mg [Erythranthe guttata]|uniref:Uncharacterized protein n=1 Tax=Erythranthe guttata TaxID=4155 RepID=A0A022Q5Q2_ERYGU|nr:hypothetical protein MIMGU_mgv1a014062mg [Erythranthe guttata]
MNKAFGSQRNTLENFSNFERQVLGANGPPRIVNSSGQYNAVQFPTFEIIRRGDHFIRRGSYRIRHTGVTIRRTDTLGEWEMLIRCGIRNVKCFRTTVFATKITQQKQTVTARPKENIQDFSISPRLIATKFGRSRSQCAYTNLRVRVISYHFLQTNLASLWISSAGRRRRISNTISCGRDSIFVAICIFAATRTKKKFKNQS